jgi:hypothetical protein
LYLFLTVGGIAVTTYIARRRLESPVEPTAVP